MKKTAEICTALAFFLLVWGILLTTIDVCCFNKDFYRRELEKNNTVEATGMESEDVIDSMVVLLDYLRYERDDIVIVRKVHGAEREVFNERETLHMIDVRDLYRNALTVRNIFLVLAAVLLIPVFRLPREERAGQLKRGLINDSLFVLGFTAFIGVWAAVDFNHFWTNFHLLFFDNDLWLLDPRTSIMINMLPGNLFFDLVAGIIIRFLICMIVLYAAVCFLVPRLWSART